MVSDVEKNLVVGIDVGGTGTKIGIVDARGEILARDESIKTPEYKDFEGFVDAMNGVVQRLIKEVGAEGRIRGIGIGAPNANYYAGTIEDNIRFGRDISHEQVIRAATMAQAHEFISGLADGYDYKLTVKGTNLSGGQKQRLLIARALAGNPDILVLDDASSALDYKTDAALRAALREDAAGRSNPPTTVIVAQRVSSIKHADLILVMDRGVVIGCGSHDELVASCTIYNEIAESQMGGAILE
mgnify:CR=1 FL=1